MKPAAVLLSAVLVLGFECGTGGESCINCPWYGYGPTPYPTLENIWPNEDGTEWIYNHEERTWEGDFTLYPTAAAVPSLPLPRWSWIFAAVEAEKPVEPFESRKGIYTLEFNGMITTAAGVVAQNLVEELAITQPLLPAGQRQGATGAKAIVVAREKLQQSFSGLALDARMKTSATAWGPTFIHGGAWEKTSDYIGTYPDSSQQVGWKFLTRDLRVGSVFTCEVGAQPGSDILLHCRIYGLRTFETTAGRFEHALDCLYILDWGVTAVSSAEGETIGYTRLIDYGRVIYAPTIGPVYCYERRLVEPGYSPSAGFGDLTETLTETNAMTDGL